MHRRRERYRQLKAKEGLLIYIHGRCYDVSSFADEHPGGRRWLDMVEGDDATALFESYHAPSSQRRWIDKKLETLRVVGHPVPSRVQASSALYSFEPEGFYYTVARRLRERFPGGCRSLKASPLTACKDVLL